MTRKSTKMDTVKDSNPYYCLTALDKISKKRLYINITTCDKIVFPKEVLSEEEMKREIFNPGKRIERFLIPMETSPFFYRDDDKQEDYVVVVKINEKFAQEHVVEGSYVRHFASTVFLSEVQDKFNGKFDSNIASLGGKRQFFGHRMDLDYSRYEEVKDTSYMEHCIHPINIKVSIFQDEKSASNRSTLKDAESSDISTSSKISETKNHGDSNSYELIYRPSMNILTCVLTTDRVPKSVGFNEDRLVISGEHSPLVDIYLPLLIDLTVPMRYKFDDKSCTFRVVLKTVENKRKVRANVVLELINSERDYVKHLKDVIEGYLHPARRHPEIFTGERINTIFSNIEELYEFQRSFLAQLELCINWDNLADSEVGQCFLDHEKGFSVYHYYCNNHPNAISELQDLYTKPRFVKFFEACRLLQNMIDISLDGFLLTPIQKICKYPLQLNELLKNTDEKHPDYFPVTNALNSMRNCANLANERKRRIEALAEVMSFQEKFENWFGLKLSDTSSILIHSGEVSKMSQSHTWSQGVQLYLFDHLLIYAKKDLLKRNNLILKGRICMDTVTEISDADEYKPKKSFKLYCGEQQKWFIFTTRCEKEKDEWIQAFERERNLVEADENEGFQITELEIGVAKRALHNLKHSRSARYKRKRPDTAIVDCQLDLDDANTIMNRTLSLPSCIHPSHVMNFVEESKVVSSSSSSRKKSSSPNSSSRSPTSISHHYSGLDQLESTTNQNSGGGSWFRKMGSKKLSKSQVYNVNGAGSKLQLNANSPTSLMTSSASGDGILVTNTSLSSNMSTTSPTATSSSGNYDELEKRHRNHMVSEEQARLFRLNNDLPPPIFGSRAPSSSKIPVRSVSKMADRLVQSISAQNFHDEQPQQQQQQSRLPNQSTSIKLDPNKLDLRSVKITPSSPPIYVGSTAAISTDGNQQVQHSRTNPSSFETTLVLSSGKVVRVREDAV